MEKELAKMITNEEGKNIPVIDSREVAEMIGKRHSEILEYINGSKKIVGIISTLENGGIRSQDYFIESSYKVNGNNKSYQKSMKIS